MKIYEGKTKKYRIMERKYSNGDKEYFIQWKGYSWYNIFWFGYLYSLNSFYSHEKAEEQVMCCINVNIRKYEHKNYVQKSM